MWLPGGVPIRTSSCPAPYRWIVALIVASMSSSAVAQDSCKLARPEHNYLEVTLPEPHTQDSATVLLTDFASPDIAEWWLTIRVESPAGSAIWTNTLPRAAAGTTHVVAVDPPDSAMIAHGYDLAATVEGVNAAGHVVTAAAADIISVEPELGGPYEDDGIVAGSAPRVVVHNARTVGR